MLRNLLRLFSVLLLSIVLVARFGITDLLASEISGNNLVELANKDRQEKNLTPLKYNKKLERAAFLKAENMFKLQYWAHYGPNKESPWQFILQSGYTYAYAGENLAKGFSDSDSVHEAWMASPTHRANIMDAQFQEVGIAVVKGNLQGSEIFLVVQMFGSPTYSSAKAAESKPTLKITSPKDGDILDDGITDIRGETKDMGNPAVTLYINKEFLGTTDSHDNQFSLTAPLTAVNGDQTIYAKGIGTQDVYMSDSVIVTVVSKDTGAVGSSKACVTSKKDISAIELSYVCQRENASFSATIGSLRFTSDSSSPRKLTMPVSSLPKGNPDVVLTITFPEGTSTAFMSNLAELGSSDLVPNNVAGTTQSSFKLSTFNLRNWVFGLFGLTFVLLLFYTAELAYKRQLLLHRFELMSFVFFIGILLVAFNFGFVRV